MNNIKAIIFDMDGVIVDSEPIHDEARRITCHKYGLKCPLHDPDWAKYKGKTVVNIFEDILKKNNIQNISAEKLADEKTKLYLEMAEKKLQPIPGAIDFIKKVKSNFEKIACTTSARQKVKEQIFRKFELDTYFDTVITREDIKNGKPHPEPFLKTVDRIGIPSENCLVIEDAVNGIVSAKKAGCVTVGITTYFKKEKLEEAGADYVVDTFDELEKILGL